MTTQNVHQNHAVHTSANDDESETKNDQFGRQIAPEYIVGIGASAGGLESLERLFGSMPDNTGMAFVVIQHLSPDFKSLMDELLARHTDLPIHRAEDGMRVAANSVYLIPPKKEMMISDGRLLLTDKDPKQSLTMPIDRFFRSLAQDCGKQSIGIILSGTGSDGSRGVQEIHAAGGLVICESKETATFDGMPNAALETGVVDQVMSPDLIPSVLTKHQLRVSLGEMSNGVQDVPAEAIDQVFKLLNDEFGIDFSHYKPNTVSRRIQRRLSLVGVHSLEDYPERLKSDQDELNALYKDLLIGVTRFFRDREAFEKLQSEVIPDLVERASTEEELRIWVAGCATGEEAYSVAIMLHEGLSNAGKPINVKIFATDVHRASLDYAGTGIYSEEALADVEPELLSRYFNKQKDGYHVIPDLRQMIVFATHNVMCDAPFTKLDLITCRNLLIYFQTTAQKKALSLFHFGLKTGGWLFLGPSESPNELLDELDVVDMHWKLYRKSRDVRLPNDMDLPLGKTLRPIRSRYSTAPVTATGQPDLTLVAAYDEMLEKFMPPGILINDKRELLHTFGGAEKYLKVASGRPSSDVLSLFDRELRNAVTGAVQRALRDNSSVSYTGIRRQNGPAEQKLRVTVDPLENRRSQSTQLLIRIDEIEPASTTPRENGEKRVDKDMRQMTADRIEDLEDELRYSKENLQATIEELETSNEEMQATNEELVASNEELQSTNEELQSVNEELYTVNAEYQKKIAELSQLTSDMDNLLESTDVGTIFLDRELNIRKFTPQIGAKFHLLPQDLGRPISSFSHNLMHPDLMDDLASVVLSEQPFEREVQDSQGKWSYLRILPYLTKGKQVDGVVMTVIDITQVKHAQEQLAMAVRRRDEFLAMLSHELRNPLGAILNATHVIDRVDVNNDVVLDAFKVVRRQGRQMSRLLDDLLDVSRVTHNKIELHMKPVDVSAIVENAIDAVKPMIDAGGLTLTTEIADQQLIVFGDESRLQQALSNLLANAARYTPVEGEVKLIATSESEEVILRVIDNGMGIPAEDLDSIFELFVQSDRSLHRAQSGMGIGLTLVRSIVEMHDGEVTVTSEGLGRGSCFEIRIPSYNPKFDESVKEPQSQEDTSTLFSGGRVVLVEDQQDARLMLRRLLELEGYEVHVADNGTKGLTAIERIRPEVALIDIGLPGIDGYELARQLRQNLGNNHTYLVALTGYGQQDDVEAAMNAGFDDHLVKPLDLEKLSKILKLHSRRSTEVNESV